MALEIPEEAWSVLTDCPTPANARRAVEIAVAAELSRMADELDVLREEMLLVDDRALRSSALGEGVRRLRERASVLRGEGDTNG